MTLPELAGVILMALGLAVVVLGFLGLCLAVWVMLAGTQEAHWPDEDPTLDVQNHIGDARPVDLAEPLDRFVLARIRMRIALMAKGYFG